MNNNKSYKAFLNNVLKKSNELHESLEQFLVALSGLKKGATEKFALDVNEKAQTLISMLAPEDQLLWLTTLKKNINIWTNNRYDSISPTELRENLINCIFALRTGIPSLKKKFSEQNFDQAFDFDSIYREYFETSRIPELFDQITDILVKISNSNEVKDISLKKIEYLKSVIATLRKNRNGSYFSILWTWNISKTYSLNLLKEIARDVPIFKTFYKAYEKTVKEINAEMEKVNLKVWENCKDKFKTSFGLMPSNELPQIDGQKRISTKENKKK